MDIYSYLRKDHRKVISLMERLLNTHEPGRRITLFKRIRQELLIQAETKHATFYAALATAKETRERIEHAERENREIRDYLKKLSRIPVESEHWIELFGELKHCVEHHVMDEEQRIFEKARYVLSPELAKKLAVIMDGMKKELAYRAA